MVIENILETLFENLPELYLPALLTIIFFPVILVNIIIILAYIFLIHTMVFMYVFTDPRNESQLYVYEPIIGENWRSRIAFRIGRIVGFISNKFPYKYIQKTAILKFQVKFLNLYLAGFKGFYDAMLAGRDYRETQKKLTMDEKNVRFENQLRNPKNKFFFIPIVFGMSSILMLLLFIPMVVLSLPLFVTILLFIILI